MSGEISSLVQAFEYFAENTEKMRESYDKLQEQISVMDLELTKKNDELDTNLRTMDSIKNHLENILESMTMGVIVLNLDGNVSIFNRAASEISGLNTLFVLCAPYTVEMVENVGFELEPSLGMNGSFPYPRDDYKATVLVLHDIQKLSKAKLKDRNLIYELRNNPNLLRIEEGPLGNINAQYDMTGEGLGNQRISA
ncbi:MAG: PAS domain-containing protein [Bacteroidetes bacterium]|nr:PAS domain-containing protein [Bacteroidota bacterium]